MNHDYTHCADFCSSCPRDCFYAQLVRDLRGRTDLWYLPLSWATMRGTKACKAKGETE